MVYIMIFNITDEILFDSDNLFIINSQNYESYLKHKDFDELKQKKFLNILI